VITHILKRPAAPLELSRGLGLWAQAIGNDEAKAQEFVARLYQERAILDTGARAATVTFVERGIGDVLIAWENEALLAVTVLGKDGSRSSPRRSASSQNHRWRWLISC